MHLEDKKPAPPGRKQVQDREDEQIAGVHDTGGQSRDEQQRGERERQDLNEMGDAGQRSGSQPGPVQRDPFNRIDARQADSPKLSFTE